MFVKHVKKTKKHYKTLTNNKENKTKTHLDQT